MPILNGEQPEAVEDYKVAMNDPGCVARLLYRILLLFTYVVNLRLVEINL